MTSKDLPEIKKATENRKIKKLSISHNQIGKLSTDDPFYINTKSLIANNCGMLLSSELQTHLARKPEGFMENRPLNFDLSGNSFDEDQKKNLTAYLENSHSKATF